MRVPWAQGERFSRALDVVHLDVRWDSSILQCVISLICIVAIDSKYFP